MRTHVIASYCGLQPLISFRQTSWYPARSHLALSKFFVDSDCIRSDRHLQCYGWISNCESSAFQNQFLHSWSVKNPPLMCQANRMYCRPFWNALYHFPIQRAFTVPSLYTTIRRISFARNSPRGQVSSVVITAHQLIPCLLRHLLHVTPNTRAASYHTLSA